MTFNEITSVRDGQDKSGRNFKTLTLTCTTFQQMTHPITGATVNAIGNSSTQTLNAWEGGENTVDSPYNHLFNSNVGGVVVGTLETREVEPYLIEDNVAGNVISRTVDTYTTFVPSTPDAANYESTAKNAFRWNGHPLASETPAATETPTIDF
jgi:hypothetical protein